jgi:O-antigen ligase
MELPNVLLNIYHNPIFGTAIGTQWYQYIRMPLFANYTTLGTHNSYLYWPLRSGILGTFGFWWMITRMWKTIALQLACAVTPEDRFYVHMSFFMMVTYMVGSFFGLMYGDTVTIIIALHMVSLQLFIEERFGIHTLKNIRFIDSLREKQIVYRYPSSIHIQPTA